MNHQSIRILARFAGGAIFLCSLCSGDFSSCQPLPTKPEQVLGEAAYKDLLDDLFPVQAFKPSDAQYRLVIRFVPSRQPESQIDLEMTNDGTVRGTMSTVIGESAWNIANRVSDADVKGNVQAIAKSVIVKKVALSFPSSTVDLWYRNLFKAIDNGGMGLVRDSERFRKTGQTEIVTDGTDYDLTFSQDTTQIHWRSIDAEVSDSGIVGRSAITRWMNQVRIEVLKTVQSRTRELQRMTSEQSTK